MLITSAEGPCMPKKVFTAGCLLTIVIHRADRLECRGPKHPTIVPEYRPERARIIF